MIRARETEITDRPPKQREASLHSRFLGGRVLSFDRERTHSVYKQTDDYDNYLCEKIPYCKEKVQLFNHMQVKMTVKPP